MVASLSKVWTASSKLSEFLQTVATILRKEGLESQKLWNLKGRLSWRWLTGEVSKRTKQWSEWQRVRWVIFDSGKRCHQSRLTKNLSIRSWIRLLMSLLFVQVNLGPEKPRSIMLHLSKHSLKSKELFILIALPSYLSLSRRGLLKSPAITQGISIRLEVEQLILKGRTFTTAWVSCSIFARRETSTLSEFHKSHSPPAYTIVSAWIASSKGRRSVISLVLSPPNGSP